MVSCKVKPCVGGEFKLQANRVNSEKGKVFEHDSGPMSIKEGKIQGAHVPERIALVVRTKARVCAGNVLSV